MKKIKIYSKATHPMSGQTSYSFEIFLFKCGLCLTSIQDINSNLFTHLFCAFTDLDSTTYTVTISSANSAPFSQFTQTVQLKNPLVKTLLSISGGASDEAAFSAMVSQASRRISFIDSSITLTRTKGFHGLDIEWEYPGSNSDMTYLGTLLDEWQSAVVAKATRFGKPPLLFMAAVQGYSPRVDGTYNYPYAAISRSLDWINVITYDFYSPDWYTRFTNCHAVLYHPLWRGCQKHQNPELEECGGAS
ncbi:OLC1v1035733C1 [Oldenlandia corymbosa var. corymbosa]|uniref:OLC1v1035733C1 n=1 Tax=Oldenlandia corymbosa var. corymbosa TaxID=529605 RepID=A0AAV1CUC7_OLDCO|nr:OLC1v1035733C1 [Oldenlandia corymbosa var. corymbosa]